MLIIWLLIQPVCNSSLDAVGIISVTLCSRFLMMYTAIRPMLFLELRQHKKHKNNRLFITNKRLFSGGDKLCNICRISVTPSWERHLLPEVAPTLSLKSVRRTDFTFGSSRGSNLGTVAKTLRYPLISSVRYK